MNRCKQIQTNYAKGQFGERLSELELDDLEHIQQCGECGDFFESLMQFESDFTESWPEISTDLKHEELKDKILQKISAEKSKFSWFSDIWTPRRGVVFAAVSLVLIFAAIFVYNPKQNDYVYYTQLPSTLTTQQVEEIYLETADIDEVDENSLDSAVSDMLSNEFVSDLSFSESVTADEFIYSEDLSIFNNFTESDWNNLRRYLS